MTIEVINSSDSIQKWVSNVNKTFDTAVGQFHIEQREYAGLVLTVTGGRYRMTTDTLITVADTEITFPGSGVFHVGLNVDTELVIVVNDGDAFPSFFIHMYTVNCSATRIISVTDLRTTNFVTSTELIESYTNAAFDAKEEAEEQVVLATAQVSLATTQATNSALSAISSQNNAIADLAAVDEVIAGASAEVINLSTLRQSV